MNDRRISFIGVGNMASAIIRGLLSSGCKASDISLFDVDASKMDSFKKQGCRFSASADANVESADIIILAVKPQIIDSVLDDISSHLPKGGVLVSIAAGVSIERIKNFVGDYPVSRVMPNACMTVSLGASAISFSDEVSDVQRDDVCSIFSSCGTVEIIDESLHNSIIAVHSSSPAFIFLFVKALVDEAEAEGIDRDSAKQLACQTLRGCADMMAAGDRSFDELISMITSKGGTTEAALKILDEFRFYDGIREAMNACRNRAVELGGK